MLETGSSFQFLHSTSIEPEALAEPRLSKSVIASGSETLAYSGNIVYIARHTNGVDVIDVLNPFQPVKSTTIDPDGPNFATVDVCISKRTSLHSLTVVGFGAMTWNVNNNRYELSASINAAPASVLVTSSGGGSGTRTVVAIP